MGLVSVNVADLFLNVLVVFASVSFSSKCLESHCLLSFGGKKEKLLYFCLNPPTVFKEYFTLLSRYPS